MSEEEKKQEDEFERRFRELEERARDIRLKATAPEPPSVPIPRRPETSTVRAQTSETRTTQPNNQYSSRGFGLALAIGYSFVGPLLAGILIGGLIDHRAGGPATIAGILVGTVVAFVLLIRLVNQLNQQ